MNASMHDEADRSRRRFLRSGMTGFAGLAASMSGLSAETSPADALHLLCSGPAGSVPDLIARTVAEQLSISFGRRAIVDNRPGAAGQISVSALKAAPADGSTLLLAQGAIATAYPYLYSKLAYDPAVDLQPVCLAGQMSLALAVGPAVPSEVMTLDGFIAWLRAHPGQANIGSPGTGTLPHLLEAMLLHEEGIAWQHVPYSGGPPAITQLLGGQIAALVLPEGLLRQHHASRRIRVVATSGGAHSVHLPDVRSFAEQGRPDLVLEEWFAFFASGRVPKAAVEASSLMLQDMMARPDLTAKFADAGMAAATGSASALSARIAAEQRHWQRTLPALGIHAD
jgi:tripartite-type tricarboxylate transporter receptor subunit TctC